MESKAQRNARLKAMRKKYGLGEFKRIVGAARKSRRKVFKSRKSVVSMAKRGKRSSKSIMSGAAIPVVGTLGYVLYETYISPRILPSTNGVAKNLVELGISVFASKRSGMIGQAGKVGVAINTYQLVRGFVAPVLGSVASGSSTISLGGNNTFI